MDNEFGLLSKELALSLDISTSNLRKWSLLIEAQGYKFERNAHNQRVYYERDIELFEDLKKHLEKERDIKNAVKTVTKRHIDKKNAKRTLSVIKEKNAENNEEITLTKDDLKEMIDNAIDEALSLQRDEFEKVIKGLSQIAADFQTQKELPSPNFDRINELQTTLKLRKQAIELWEHKPEEERFIKTGLFRKEEDKIKRDDFIQEYIAEKLIEHYAEKEKEKNDRLGS